MSIWTFLLIFCVVTAPPIFYTAGRKTGYRDGWLNATTAVTALEGGEGR